MKNGHCLVPALFAIFFPTIGLFIFGKLPVALSLLSIKSDFLSVETEDSRLLICQLLDLANFYENNSMDCQTLDTLDR
jgi:hypothetical protein